MSDHKTGEKDTTKMAENPDTAWPQNTQMVAYT